LSKLPAARFQTIKEVSAALEQVTATPARNTPSIAVLPFANMSRDADDEYFSDGLAEEIINALSQMNGLKVIARTSAFAFKGKNEDIRKIAETLGVSNVLEGSVRRAGNRLRITAQLIHAADGSHLWSHRYDREMTDVFAIQDEISATIASQLKVSLISPGGFRKHTPKFAAYEALLQGRHYVHQFSSDGSARGLEYFQRAISIDPDYAAAHNGLAAFFLWSAAAGMADPRSALPKGRAAA
jgi:TolB-like protein